MALPKVCLLGDSGVGKTLLSNRLINVAPNEDHGPTVGANWMEVTHENFSFQLWDTAGQERYRAITPLYVRGSLVALVLFDRASEPSFRSVPQWVELARDASLEIVVILVGSKTDLEGSVNVVSHADAERLVHQLDLNQYIALSSISGFGIDILLDALHGLLTGTVKPDTVAIHPVQEVPDCC
jgi:small GTP-binding protein